MDTSPTARSVLAVLALVAVAACTSDGSGDDEPTADRGTAAIEVGEPPETDPPPPPEGDGDPVGTTTSLVPSPEADLPTELPQTADDPAEGPTGPLPVPSVQLVPVGEFDSPVGLARRPNDSRWYVVEQGGRVIAADDESATEVLDVTDLTSADGERGLLGLAFHPALDLAYVNYTDVDGNTVVAEFAVDPGSAVFDTASFREVLTVEQPFSNHNGGAMEFGPDGFLYIGLGDGGSADDPLRAGLDLSTRLGKLLRIDPVAADDEPFTVPGDNPFVGDAAADPTIWSFGLRNPWRVTFDGLTGELWIADVGQNEIEEVNRAPATDGLDAGRGLNFGWSAFEGTFSFNTDQPDDDHTPPEFQYSHEGGNCSVSGGVVARQSPVPDLDGWYVYGDYCSGTIWGYDTTSPRGTPVIVELAELGTLTSIAAGPEGELYAVSQGGTVARIAGS